MNKFNNPLNQVRIAAPCSADWDQMVGDEQVRFCAQCNLNVYNLSAMTRSQAESLISKTEGKLCARYYRRSDGTVLTANCPVGLRAIARRVKRISAALISALIGLCTGLGASFALKEEVGGPGSGVLMGTIAQRPVEQVPLSKPNIDYAQPRMGKVKVDYIKKEKQ